MSGPPATVFVVDDDASVRRAVERLLRTAGFRVEVFASGAEFLEQVGPARQGCLVLDVRMPGQSGFDLFDRLIADGRQLPVIFVTGHGDQPMAQRATNADSADFHFLVKPFEAEDLIAAVTASMR